MARRPRSPNDAPTPRPPAAETTPKRVTFKVALESKPAFEGPIAAYVFDSAGRLVEQTEVRSGKLVLAQSERSLAKARLFIAPAPEGAANETPRLSTMERLGAYEPVVQAGGQLTDSITVPGPIIDGWLLCRCWVRGRVVKADTGLPVCNARVHICEVDKVWRWIVRLPELDIWRLRDDLLRVLEEPPRLGPDPWPGPIPGPDPAPFDPDKLGPQPEPPDLPRIAAPDLRARSEAARVASRTTATHANAPGIALRAALPIPLPGERISAMPITLPDASKLRLRSDSVHMVREALIQHADLLLPYLCLWPWWWTFRCDEIAVVETDGLGRFETSVYYRCDGDKPDLYFWVEYEIDGTMETVYHPPIPCNTYWNYACGTEVTLRVADARVPACDDEPDLPGCVVQILSIGRTVSLSELQGPGAAASDEGLTTNGRPFGGKIEPRVWFSRTTLRDGKNIRYYRWSQRRLTEGDGTPLAMPGPWVALSRTVVRHYAVMTAGGISHPPFPLGPNPVGGEPSLFEIKPSVPPAGGIEWTVLDEREDLASAHFESHKLGTGTDACDRALTAAGKYELKLELFKADGSLVDWTAEGIDLEVTDVPAPFGTSTVTASTAPAYNRIVDGAGHTTAFRMVLRVDNNCCEATVHPVSGIGLTTTPCGFLEFIPGASAALGFSAHHPNGFATFSFSVRRGVTAQVQRASASGRVGAASVPTNDATLPVRAYSLTPPSDYAESFPVGELLGPCTRAAFSEALHVWTMSTDGYNRLSGLDSFNHAGFALTPP